MKVFVDHKAQSPHRTVILTYETPVELPDPYPGMTISVPGLGSDDDGFSTAVPIEAHAPYDGSEVDAIVEIASWEGPDDEALDAHIVHLRAHGWMVGDDSLRQIDVEGLSPLFHDAPDPESGWYTDKLDLAWIKSRIEEGWRDFEDPHQYAEYVTDQLLGQDPRVLHAKMVCVDPEEATSLRWEDGAMILSHGTHLNVRFQVRGSDACRYTYEFSATLFFVEIPVRPDGPMRGRDHLGVHPLSRWRKTKTSP